MDNVSDYSAVLLDDLWKEAMVPSVQATADHPTATVSPLWNVDTILVHCSLTHDLVPISFSHPVVALTSAIPTELPSWPSASLPVWWPVYSGGWLPEEASARFLVEGTWQKSKLSTFHSLFKNKYNTGLKKGCQHNVMQVPLHQEWNTGAESMENVTEGGWAASWMSVQGADGHCNSRIWYWAGWLKGRVSTHLDTGWHMVMECDITSE
jgi:hypothetical protein